MSASYDAWSRRLKLLQLLLHRGRIQTADVSRALDIDRKIALDDLKKLELCGVPMSPVGEGTGRTWVLEESWRKLGLVVGFEERLSLLLGRSLMESFLGGTDLGAAMRKLDTQVEAMSNDGLRLDKELARRFLYVREPEKDLSAHKDTVNTLVEAVMRSHRVSFLYQHARAPRDTVAVSHAAPYTLVVYKRGLYVLVDCRGEVTLHAVERILEITSHPEQTFEYPWTSDYDPQKRLAKLVGLAHDGSPPETVRLRFTPEGRPYAEARVWMPGQRVEPREDGGCDVVFEAAGLELLARVLEYGELVEVISPESLRSRVRDTLARTLARYEQG